MQVGGLYISRLALTACWRSQVREYRARPLNRCQQREVTRGASLPSKLESAGEVVTLNFT